MANKEVMERIAARARTRAQAVLDAHDNEPDGDGTASCVAAALLELAAQWRDDADLWMESGTKAKQSTATELRQAAARVAGVAQDIKALTPSTQTAADQTDIPPDVISRVLETPEVSISGSALADEVKAEQMADVVAGAPSRFLIPSASTAPYIGPRIDPADLLRPAHNSNLTRWSHSQVETSENCGTQYLLRKVIDMPRVPQWALIGGRAFHACVQAIETDTDAHFNAANLWGEKFSKEIAETAAQTTVPMDQWRASNKGSENYTWWLHEGADMVQRYVDNPLPGKLVIDALGPFVERELSMLVPHTMVALGSNWLEFVGILDMVRQMDDGSLLIVDLKSGARKPSDIFQLGAQTHLLAQYVHDGYSYAAGPLIKACYYDARKGTTSEPIEALDAVSWDEVVWRVNAAEARRRTGLYSPRPSSFCGGCDVRYACPVGSR